MVEGGAAGGAAGGGEGRGTGGGRVGERAEPGFAFGEMDGGEVDGLAGDEPAVDAGDGRGFGLPGVASGAEDGPGAIGCFEDWRAGGIGGGVGPGERTAGFGEEGFVRAPRHQVEQDFGDGGQEGGLAGPTGGGGVEGEVGDEKRDALGFQQRGFAVGESCDDGGVRRGGEAGALEEAAAERVAELAAGEELEGRVLGGGGGLPALVGGFEAERAGGGVGGSAEEGGDGVGGAGGRRKYEDRRISCGELAEGGGVGAVPCG